MVAEGDKQTSALKNIFSDAVLRDLRGALVAALLVGFIDTLGRAYLIDFLRMVLSQEAASTAGPAISSMLIYLLMAVVLIVKPEGLFSAGNK